MLSRLLTAAHFVPSVGFMQPWSFLLVRDPAVKRRVYDAFLRANADDLADAGRLPGLSIKTRLAITCLDQIGDDKVTYYGGGLRRRASIESFVSAVSRAVGASDVLLGFGADRELVMLQAEAARTTIDLYQHE